MSLCFTCTHHALHHKAVARTTVLRCDVCGCVGPLKKPVDKKPWFQRPTTPPKPPPAPCGRCGKKRRIVGQMRDRFYDRVIDVCGSCLTRLEATMGYELLGSTSDKAHGS